MMRILLFFSLLLLSCANNTEPEAPQRQPPVYYYYPKANVYFDSANKEYAFLATDNKTWQTARDIPAVVQAMMDKTILIQNPPDPVWKDNEQHKLIYSAVLYATPNDTVKNLPPPKPEVKKPDVVVDSTVKKERKGLRKFFDKIFGGLKKEKKKTDSAR